ncbi:hypothetical protein EV645_1938 [Kribbella rubisoli]|uniref:Uncharacterized protein n=1 Tax=Kribbella rubisoli TaxID=3075929 RepID=A0A4Q7X980_9ACTN|nr:hypothetical protein [Kribbella rubisoli]RZU19720.1 hypothetical protein EV645_1938 [Kribbella rubisoli]
MPSRRELLDALVDDVTRTTLRSAELGPEDRVLARQRVEEAIQRTATRAQGDVVALAHGDSAGPEAERFSAHMNSSYQEHGGPDPAVRDSAAGQLAAELVASDDRTNRFHPALRDRAEAYIAHSVTAAAVSEAQKASRGPSQAPAAAAGAAAAVGAAAGPAGVVAGPAGVVAAPVDIANSRLMDLRAQGANRRGPSIG